MFTVVRFLGDSSLLPALADLGSDMNRVRPGVFNGLRKAGDGFSCDISSSDSWKDHAAEAITFIQQFRHIVSRAISLGAGVSFDVAVEPEDRGFRSVVLDNVLLSVLAEAKVTLEVSVYPAEQA